MQLDELYASRVAAAGLHDDPDQRKLIEHFQRVSDQLSARPAKTWKSFLGKTKPQAIKGLYIYGGVGRGKTWMMDMFFDALAEEQKLRLHFHRFMQMVHAELTQIKGEKDPLKKVAANMAKDTRVLCLDEFHVVDIGDAMILAGLLRALFEENVVLLTTSNVHPDDLYKDGLQRASFLPAIEMLNQKTDVVSMGGDRDFRVQIMSQALVYHWPHGQASDAAMLNEFEQLATGELSTDQIIRINNREMPYRYYAEGLAWFDFEALCGPPRSQHDYIELARSHHTVFISNIPSMGAARDDRTRRFIFLIDEFYDRKVKVVISAEVPLMRLYKGERLAFEFQRTVSRLTEMQTPEYLGSTHIG